MTAEPTLRPSRRPRRALVVLAAAALALVTVPGAAANATATGDPAYLRPAHLVPELGAMDVRLAPFADEGEGVAAEDRPLLETTAAYGAVGEYGAMTPGRYAVTLRPAGTPVSEPPLLSLTVDLEAGQAYTAAGLGTKDDPRLELLDDDLTPPGDGQSRVRLLAASAAAPVVDVEAVDGPVLGTDVALGTPTGYESAPVGPWTVQATGDGASGTTDLVLDSGSVYTLLVLDGEGDELVVRPVVDAVGAGTTPQGGAATGFGGGVPDDARTPLWIGAGVLLVLGASALTASALVRSRPWARTTARHVAG
ncbi:DUF4397 domain-containing protein [Aquipuribacter sp. MA13-6]|uniref:DUF4397 domain-containing protein n=1 Tax=unclassified Aquipuribacter TaxID=2635084 RepID=UPI003EEB2E75